KNPVMGLGETALVAAILFHAFNGLRIIAVDFWKSGPKYQRQMLWTVLVVWAVVFVAFAIRQLSIVFGG
ncbi:MAG: succinate dehydrogenase, cytochrome b556 subunit, partial [Sinomonas sp.]